MTPPADSDHPENRTRVCPICPECGGLEYRKRRAKGFAAFTSDRECVDCGTLYRPPTPIWAAFVFLLVGLPMLAGGAVVFVLVAPNPCAMAIWACLATLGVLAARHGVRALIWPGKV